jgi:uncharacterized surface protein with fasciclin (FAS1) repeats
MFKKFSRVSYIFLVLMLMVTISGVALAAPVNQEEGQDSLVDVAVEEGRFTTLVAALDEANLTERLRGEGPFTVFAPTDEAFAQLPPDQIESLFNDVPALENLLLYHVVEDQLSADEVTQQEQIETITGKFLNVTVEGESVQVDGAQVLETIEATNGIVHVIDTVLMPPVESDDEAMQPEGTAEPTAETMQPEGTAEPEATMEAETGQMATTCTQDYVIQADDTLSNIADKFLGSPGAYPTIVEATNGAAAENDMYTTIDDPNFIVVGQTLCIPDTTALAEETSAMAEEEAMTATDEPMMEEAPMVSVPEGQSVVLFENQSPVDLVVDLSGPTPDSLVVPPATEQEFVIEPGQYNYNAHQPGGDYSLAPGEFSLEEGQIISLTCYGDGSCRVEQMEMAATAEPEMTGTPEPAMEETMEPGMEETTEPAMEETVEPEMEETAEPELEETVEPEMEETAEPETDQ